MRFVAIGTRFYKSTCIIKLLKLSTNAITFCTFKPVAYGCTNYYLAIHSITSMYVVEINISLCGFHLEAKYNWVVLLCILTKLKSKVTLHCLVRRGVKNWTLLIDLGIGTPLRLHYIDSSFHRSQRGRNSASWNKLRDDTLSSLKTRL